MNVPRSQNAIFHKYVVITQAPHPIRIIYF